MNTQILDLTNSSSQFESLKLKYFAQTKEIFECLNRDLVESNKQSEDLLQLDILVRNIYVSPLFNLIAKVLIGSSETCDGRNYCIKLDSEEEYQCVVAYNSSLRRHRFLYPTQKKTFVRKALSLTKIICHLALSKTSSFLLPKMQNLRNMTLVDLFVMPGMLSSDGNLEDRYYNRFRGSSEEFLEQVVYLPTLTRFGIKSYWRWFKFSLRDAKTIQIISKERHLNYSDLILVYKKLVGAPGKFDYGSLNQDSLYLKPYIDYCLHTAVYDLNTWKAYLSRLSYERIFKSHKEKIESVLDWNENQPTDRALNLAAKSSGIYEKVTGYHGGTVMYSWNFHFRPADYEVQLGLYPKKIAVLGEIFKKELETTKFIDVKVIPAFRFGYLWNPSSPLVRHNEISRKIVLILPYFVNECRELVQAVLEQTPIELHSEIEVKAHPATEMEVKEIFKNLAYVRSPSSELVHTNNLFIGFARTSLIFECLAVGQSIIAVNPEGLINLSQFSYLDNFSEVTDYAQLGDLVMEKMDQLSDSTATSNLEYFFMKPNKDNFQYV